MFILNQTVKLRWGTWAMKRFCERMGTDIDGFFEILTEIGEGKATNSRMLLVLENFLHAGYEYANGEPATDQAVDGWIDECGGVVKINQGQIVDYLNYVISLTVNGVTPLNGDDSKKKDEVPGMTS